MKFFIVFNQSLLPILVIITLAFFYDRIFKPDIKSISEVVLTVFAPIMVFDALVSHKVRLANLGKPILFMIVMMTCLILLSYLAGKIFKFNKDDRISIILATSMINVGNFGLPLILFTFGEKAVALSVIYFIIFLIPLNTLGIYISSDGENVLEILKGMMKMPLFHSIFIALLITNLSVSIPAFLEKSIHLTGNAAIPMLLFILGLQLSKIRFHSGYLIAACIVIVIRLIISPVIAYFTLDFLSIQDLEKQVAIIQTSAPSAVLPLIYAIKFNRSPDLLAALILATTIVSGLTLTVLISIIN